MNHNARWARENLEDASGLSDSRLIQISEAAWGKYRVARAGVILAGFALVFAFDDRVIRYVLGAEPSFWQASLVTGTMAGLVVGTVHYIFQRYLRSYIREAVSRE